MTATIFIYGSSNVGKTKVINDIYYDLENSGATVKMERRKRGAEEDDFAAILEFNGKTVAFLSMGDIRSQVRGDFELFKDCDIFIVAYNEWHKTIYANCIKYSEIIHKVVKIEPTDSDNKRVRNEVKKLLKKYI